MKKFIKNNFVTPSVVHSRFLSYKYNYINKFNSCLKFKNISKNKDCVILGTGPSINEIDISKFANTYTFSLNLFLKHEQINLLKKNTIVIAPIHTPLTFDVYKYAFSTIINKKIESNIFLGESLYEYNLYNFFKENHKYDEIKKQIYYLNYFSSMILSNKNINNSFIHDISKGPLYSPRQNLSVALQLAYYMGFKNVYLYGVDMDAIKKNKDYHDHFYSKHEEFELNDDPLYLKNKSMRTRGRFKWFYNLWNEFELLKKFYEENGMKIFNSNPNSYLNVFDFKEYNN